MRKPIHLDEQTWEAMESCRSSADDLADPAMAHLAAEMAANPELAKLLDRIEQVDAKIGAAFHDVSVPHDLLQRLTERLSSAQVENAVTKALNEQPDQSLSVDAVICKPVCGERRVSRRWILVAGGIFSAAAISFIALWLNLRNVESYSEQTVLDEAIRFFGDDTADAGFSLAEKTPPKDYPFSQAIYFSNNIRWREIHSFIGQTGIAYDLPGRNGARATVYVIEQSIEGLGNNPQLQPFTTGGYSTSAWQEGRLLYVLVVQGEAQTYQSFLNLPRGPVA